MQSGGDSEEEMPRTFQTEYQSISNMDPEERRVSGKTFYVYCAGKTNGAERQIVAQLKATGQIEVTSTENSDYLVVFCPVSSRVGTDIKDALDNVRDDKAVILVVMHHTFDRNHVISESRRQVDKSNVILTVDYLFYEDKILDCSRNDIALFDIKKTLGVPNSQLSLFSQFRARCRYWTSIYRWQIIGFSLGIMLIVAITLVVVEKKKK